MKTTQTVLLVDDNAMNITNMAHILSDYECLAAKSGADALMTARDLSPDIILLDILMPDMDGYEVLAALKADETTAHIPVILVTGLSDENNEERGLELGAADYIHKANSAAVIKLRVRRQLEYIHAMQKIEESGRAKSEFLAKMSHEIRTPMNAVIGITNIQLQKTTHPPETEDAFLQIRSSSDILLSLINDILDLSKVEAGKMQLFEKPYKTAELITNIVQLNLTHIGKKNILFKLDISKDIPQQLIGDEIRIRQITTNLLSNAFKYTDEGGVTLSVWFESNTLKISVKDTGHGIHEEQLANLFNNEYVRFNEQQNRHIEGTGLGLNIAHRLTEAMGGEITVTSEVGKGSEFCASLPQGIESPEPLGEKQAESLQSFRFSHSTQTQYFEYEPMPYGRVLVVDDIESNLFVAQGLMQPYSLTVETVQSAAEALNLIQNGEIYDIIFVDHMMPDISGIELTKIIRETGYLKPIIAMSANTVNSDMYEKSGFDGYISKPIDMNILHSALIRHIRDQYPDEVVKIAKATYSVRNAGVSEAILLGFLRDANRVHTTLQKIFEKPEWTAKDLEVYTVNTHGMKSALLNINETKLSHQAARLEKAGRESDRLTIRTETPKFLAELEKITAALDKTAIKTQDTDLLYEGLKTILILSDNRNRTDARDVLYELGKYTWNMGVKALLGRLSAYLLHSEFIETSSEISGFLEAAEKLFKEKLQEIANFAKKFDDFEAYAIIKELKEHELPYKVKRALKRIDGHLLHGDYKKAAEAAESVYEE